MNRSHYLFRDLHRLAQRVEQEAFLIKVYKNTDIKKYQEAKRSYDEQWKEMEQWKKYMDEELKTKSSGKIFWGG